MKLTTKGRYAVMAMADLASNTHFQPISLTEIAQRQNISLAYLEQIFIKLKNLYEINHDKILNKLNKCGLFLWYWGCLITVLRSRNKI